MSVEIWTEYNVHDQSGIVLDQVPIQSLLQVPIRHLSKWLKGTWTSETLCRYLHSEYNTFLWQENGFSDPALWQVQRTWHSVEWSHGLMTQQISKIFNIMEQTLTCKTKTLLPMNHDSNIVRGLRYLHFPKKL